MEANRFWTIVTKGIGNVEDCGRSAFQVQRRITLPAYAATSPEWLVKHLLKTTHNRVLWFIGGAHGQFGLLAEKILKPAKRIG